MSKVIIYDNNYSIKEVIRINSIRNRIVKMRILMRKRKMEMEIEMENSKK